MVRRKRNRKEKIIKRIYEEGREKTVFQAKRKAPTKKHIKEVTPPPERAAILSKPPAFVAQKIKEPAHEYKLPPRIQETPHVDHCELPSGYGTTRLVLMAKDPFWIFAYWEIAGPSIESLKEFLPREDVDNSRTVLRMYDVTLKDFDGTNANYYFDIEVGEAKNWYVNLWGDNASYVGDIGLRIPDGRFFALARSNFAHTPRANYSPRSEQIWMEVTAEKYRESYAPGEKFEESPISLGPAKTSKPSVRVTQISATKKKTRVFYLTDEDIKQYYGKLSPLLREIIGYRIQREYAKKAMEGIGKAHYFLLEGETEEERKRLLSFLLKGYFVKRLRLGSSEELVITEGASEHLVKRPGASDFVEERINKRKFFFELNTELIVYGRTEPDAEVWLGDKKVNLRPDGTFSLRFALPDGKIPLEFKAVSGDKKEEKSINTYVERNTIRK